jgi:hypothetical protein
MLEIVAVKTWNGLVKQSPRLKKWMRILPPGIWILAAVIILIGGRMIWVNESRPAHLREITDAFGAVRLFYDVQINHSGSRFTYVATSDHGYGLFLCDTATAHKQLLRESKIIKGNWWGKFYKLHAWAWSPDDSSFIYGSKGKLVIYSTDAKSSVPLNIDADTVSDVAWFNSAEFAYVVGETNLCYAGRQSDGQWKLHELSRSAMDKILCLTAVATNAVAWLQGNYICRINLTDDMTGTNNPLASLSPDTNAMPPTNGLVLWLDASTLHQADQTPVMGLTDLSSQRNDTIPIGIPPTYNAPDSERGLNGRGTIHFASNGSVANATGLKTKSKLGITGLAPRTVFAVMRRDDGRQMIINIGDTVTKGTYFGICAYYYGICLADACDLISVIHRSSVDWKILEASYNGTAIKGYVNGALESSITYPLNTVDKEVEIGIRTANSKGENATASDGDFGELLIYNRALDDTERQQVEQYLSVKWFGVKPLSARNPLVWFDPKLPGITGFNYSKETGEFLLDRTENDRDSLWQFDPETDKLSRITEADSIRDAQWIGEHDCAYLSIDSGHKHVMLVDPSGAQKKSLLESGDMDWLKAMPDGKQLLIGGTFNNEPSSGIWQYDLDSEQLRPVVPYSDYPSIYAKDVDPLYGSVELASGHKLNYLLYMPANFDRHKKYPLVIGCTPFWNIKSHRPGDRPWLPGIVASCGAFVVSVDRAGWFDGIEQWGENVTDVYQRLIQNPCIDKNQVFLFGASAETQYLSELMSKSPGLWKGAILLNPGQLPDFSNSPLFQQRPKILISAGSEEHEDERLKKYQLDALKSGVMVEYIIHPGEGHQLVGNAAWLERTRAITHFIYEE